MNVKLNWTNLARYGCPDDEGIYLCKWNNGDIETFEYFAGDSETSDYWTRKGNLFVTWWAPITPEMDPEFATSIECPACGEITLQRQSVTSNHPFIETWECDCGHIQCFHVPNLKARRQKGDRDGINQ